MRNTLLSGLLFLAATLSFGQATNPQWTFDGAVNINNPSLWLNYNDSTTAFMDSISGQSFVGTATVSATAGPHCTYGAASSSSLACGVITTATDAVVVWIGIETATVSSVTDSLGASAVLIGSPATGVYAYYFANVTSGSHTITATLSASSAYPVMTVVDVVNAATTSPVDSHVYNAQASTTAVTSGALTTTMAGDLLIANVTEGGGAETWTAGSPAFAIFTNATYNSQANGTYAAGAAGSYTFNVASSAAYTWGTWIVAIKPKTISTGTVLPRQPGFDNTNNANYSAAFPYNGWNAAPNNTLGSSMEWNTLWTMMLHINKLNFDHTGTIVLASKGDSNGAAINNIWWKLFLQPNGYGSQLCFERSAPAPYTLLTGGAFVVDQRVCTTNSADAMPNSFNYNIMVEDNGSGSGGGISMWINGTAQSLVYPVSTAQGFGGVTLAITSGGTGYTSAPILGTSGGGTNCSVGSSIATVSGGAVTAVSNYTLGCTSAPAITVTGGGGSGAVVTATAYMMKMNSSTYPLMVPGYVYAGNYYGADASDSSQGAVNVDEFAIFPGNLSFGQLTNIFYDTKFYQGLLYSGLTSNPPLVIFNTYGCGPDFSGDQTMAMIINAHKAGLIRLIGIDDDDGQGPGWNSIGWFRQMLDEAGMADVPVAGQYTGAAMPNTGGCYTAQITAVNASTPQNPSSYMSSTTLYRTLFAKYSTQPIYVLMTQTANGYNLFQLSGADGISTLTGLQLQQQNYNNGGYVNAFEGNFNTTPSYYLAVLNNIGSNPIYFEGGSPAAGGPGTIASRTAMDPFYLAAYQMGTAGSGETVYGWTNQNVAQLLTPYFLGGVQITLSGGTGYAAYTPFTSVGGGPNCVVTGLMKSASGVPSSTVTPWNSSIATTYSGLGYGCTPAQFTATGSGTNLTVSAMTIGKITVGDTLSGTGIPTGTTIVSQTSGTAGAVGVYVTSAATTAAAATVLREPTIVLTAPTGTGVTMTVVTGTHLNSYEGSGTAQYAIWPNMWGQSQVFTWFENSLIDPPTTGMPRAY